MGERCHISRLRGLPLPKMENLSKSEALLCGPNGKESACSTADLASLPQSGRSPGEENGKLLQYSSLQNPMDRWAWGATVHGRAESDTKERLTLWLFTPRLRPATCLTSHVTCSGGETVPTSGSPKHNSICSRAALPRKGSTLKLNLMNFSTLTSTHLSFPTHPIIKLTHIQESWSQPMERRKAIDWKHTV